MIKPEYKALQDAIESLAIAQRHTTAKTALTLIQDAMDYISQACASYITKEHKTPKSHVMPKGMSTTKGKL